MKPIDLTGATVISVDRGSRLTFVTSERIEDEKQLREFTDRLGAFLGDVEFQVVFGIDEVIVKEAEPLNDIEATGGCCCNGCIGEGRCDLGPLHSDSDEDDRWEANCGFCPDDCQICSSTPHCDCPTHGGHDA